MVPAEIQALDRADPLAAKREAFVIPEGLIYLDGNSLGPLPKRVAERMREVVEGQWGQDLIRSWNLHGWIGLPQRLGARIARLIGAEADEVVVADSTSVNLFKVLLAALELRPGRRVILSEVDNFPTDLYIAQGLRELREGCELRFVPREEIEAALDEETAVLLLTEVDYRTGYRHDMAHLTRLAQARGALVVWDLAHSAGAFPVHLNACGVDFAVGCGYKYLNGGPGAPAFLYVARRHQKSLKPFLTGWMGHWDPFAFSPTYTPAEGLRRMTVGTPPILSMSALEAALEVWEGVEMAQVREKSLRLTDLFIERMAPLAARYGLELATPLEHARRGSQVAYRHPEGYAIVQALIAQGVVGDFRHPNILRFGFGPLYLRYADVYEAVERFERVMAQELWQDPRYREKAQVT
ncbi:MAG: kynureninase [Meiothermus sp.]|uniref:kynureninase n=1 Tax=Meiothermus sp. TaxID=1955249 RepID=UPI002614DF90|nr:kynureninase [Meiothermus sp.]MCS7058258.1 kynureninase [Meiothermus sp.]MDW8090363.1 kynureninase [Meiothermus sp.]